MENIEKVNPQFTIENQLNSSIQKLESKIEECKSEIKGLRKSIRYAKNLIKKQAEFHEQIQACSGVSLCAPTQTDAFEQVEAMGHDR